MKLLVVGEADSIDDVLPFYAFTISESVPKRHIVGTIGTGDNTLKMQLLNENSVFEVDEQTGMIRTKDKVQVIV